MYKAAPLLAKVGAQEPGAADAVDALAARTGATDSAPFATAVQDFYLTNPIARSSAVMAELSALRQAMQTPVAAE